MKQQQHHQAQLPPKPARLSALKLMKVVGLLGLVALSLTGCGSFNPVPTSPSTLPTPAPPTLSIMETDFGPADFLRDALIAILVDVVQFVGSLAVGLMEWFVSTMEGLDFTSSANRTCGGSGSTTINFANAANVITPITGCANSLYDQLRALPLLLAVVGLALFGLRYTVKYALPGQKLSLAQHSLNLGLAFVSAMWLDAIVSILIALATSLFLLILTVGGASSTGPLQTQVDSTVGPVLDLVLTLEGGLILIGLTLGGLLLTVGGFSQRYKEWGAMCIKAALIGGLIVGGATLIGRFVVDYFTTLNGGPLSPGSGAGNSSGPSPLTLNQSLDKLKDLFNIAKLHQKNVALALLLMLAAVPSMLAFVVIGLFFFVRVILLILWFVLGVPAMTARFLEETELFYVMWWRGLAKILVTIFPLAVVLRLGLAVAGGLALQDNPINYILLMLVVTVIFGAGAALAIFILFVELKSGVAFAGQLGGAARSLVSRVTGKAGSGATAGAGVGSSARGSRSRSGLEPRASSTLAAASSGSSGGSGGSRSSERQTLASGTAQRTLSSGSAGPGSSRNPLPLNRQDMAYAVSTGMNQALASRSEQTERMAANQTNQLVGMRQQLEQLNTDLRQYQANFAGKLEATLRELTESIRAFARGGYANGGGGGGSGYPEYGGADGRRGSRGSNRTARDYPVGLDGPGEEPGYYLASTNGVNSGPAPTPRAYQRRNEAGRPLPIRRQGGSGSESYTYYAPASGPMPPAATAPGAAPNYYANPVFDQSPGAQAGRASRRPARPRPGPLVRPTTTSARRSGGSGAGLNRPDLTPNQATNARPVPAPLEYGAASVSSPPVPSRPDYLPTAQPPLNPVSTSSNGSGGGNSDDGNSGGLARRTSLRPRLSGADLYSRETGLAYGATPPVARAARSTASNRPSSRP